MTAPLSDATTLQAMTPSSARAMTPRAALRSAVLQALAHHYGAVALHDHAPDDAFLDLVLERIAQDEPLQLGTDMGEALRTLRSGTTSPRGASLDTLRREALNRLLLAAGLRPSAAPETFVTQTPLGRVKEERGSTWRVPAEGEELTPLPATPWFVFFDADALPSSPPEQGGVLIHTVLSGLRPAPLCGTESVEQAQAALIRRGGAAGTISVADFPTVMQGLLEDAEDNLMDAARLGLNLRGQPEEVVRVLIRLYGAAPASATGTPF